MTQTLVLDSPPAAPLLFSQPTEFDDAWKARIAHLAGFIDGPGPVVDVGCGLMWLEPFLLRGNQYLPIDHVRRDARTLVLDLNHQPWPNIEAEFIYLSGVLEYIHDVPGFFRQLMAQKYRRILFTYCTLECWWKMSVRQSLNWVSHESLESLLNVLLPDYRLVTLQRVAKHVAVVVELRDQ